MRRLLIPALTALFLCFCGTRALAADRMIYYQGQQLPPSWLTQQERNHRIELGTIMLAEGLNGVYSNLTTLPSPGLYVTVGPALGNSNGVIFQLVSDDTSAYGDATTHLPADPTQIVADALLNGPSAPVGPLAAPTSSGQEIIYLIEAQVVPSNDHNQVAQTFLDNQGNPSTTNVNELRSDDATIVAKGSAPGVTPSQPTPDSGYIPISYVTVSTGQASISPNNIQMNPATAFNGFAQVGTVTANSCAYFDANKHISSGGCNTAFGSPTTVSAGSSNVIVTQTTGGNYAIDIARALSMTAATYSGNATISPANGATSSVNYGSAGTFGLQNSIWNGGAAQTHTWAWNALPSGSLVAQYDGSTKWTIDNAGNVTATSFSGAFSGNGSGLTNLPLNQFSGLTASTCLRASSPTTIISATGDCIVAGSAGVSANSSVCTDANAALTSSGCNAPVFNASSQLGLSPVCTTTIALQITTSGCNIALTSAAQTLTGTQTISGSFPLSFSSTSGATVTSNATGPAVAFTFNANNPSAPTTDLLDVQKGGSTLFSVQNGGGAFSSDGNGPAVLLPMTTIGGASLSSTAHFIEGVLTVTSLSCSAGAVCTGSGNNATIAPAFSATPHCYFQQTGSSPLGVVVTDSSTTGNVSATIMNVQSTSISSGTLGLEYMCYGT